MLLKLIQSLSKEETRHYKLLANATKKADKRIDIELFDFLRKNNKHNSELLFQQIHYPNNPNPYYRLKNRLMGQIYKTLLHLHHASDQHHEVLECIELGRIFYKKEFYEICEYFLTKAEKKALKLDDFDYLNIIYRELITLSFELNTINPEELIEKQRDVYEKQIKIKEINNVVAIVKHQLRRSQNLGKGNVHINNLLKATIDKHSHDQSLLENYQFQYAIYQIISQYFLNEQNWPELFSFVEQKFKDFKKFKFFSKNNHEAKLQMITYLINAAYKKREVETSLNYTELLYDEMMKFDNIFYHKYLFFYYQAMVLNCSETNPLKAIRVLNEIKDDKEFVSNSYYVQFIQLNLSLLYLDQGMPVKGLESISALLKSDYFKTFDNDLKAQLHLLNLVMYYELEQFEQLLKYAVKLTQLNVLNAKEKVWLSALQLLAGRANFEIDEKLRSNINNILNSIELDKGDEWSVFDFNGWVKAVCA